MSQATMAIGRTRVLFLLLLGVVSAGQTVSVASAGDWPQILGPQRNGVATGEALAKVWPKAPAVVWQQPVGPGLAGIAVANGTAYVFHREDNRELLVARDAVTGKQRWQQAHATDYQDQIAGDDGPRCVPLVQGDAVYTFGAAGQLARRSTATGQLVWELNIVEKYSAPLGYFGAGSTPLLVDDKLIVNVGSERAGAGVVAFSTTTGAELWKSTADTASYSAPIAATIDGKLQIICITRLNCVGLDPATGKSLWSFRFGQRGPTVNGASPVFLDGHLLTTASYGVGAVWSKLSATSATEVWADEIVSSQYITPVSARGWVYAIDGREDVGTARLLCFHPHTRKVAWEEPDFGMAPLILAGDVLLAMKTNGTLVALSATEKKFEKLAEYPVCESTTRALPALANGRLYVRDTRLLKCLQLPTVPRAETSGE